MTNQEEWNEFLGNLFSNAIGGYKKSEEYEYRRQHQNQIDDFFGDLSAGQKELMEEILYELGLSAEYEAEAVYRRGLKDCVWLLKKLGVLA